MTAIESVVLAAPPSTAMPFRISDVADNRDRSVTDLMSDLLDLFGSPRGNRDADTLACEGECDCASDAPAAASNQSCFSHI